MTAPLYRKMDGQDYVLLSHAAHHVEGMAADTINMVVSFVKAYRPDDKGLHEAIASLKDNDTEASHILDGVPA